MTTRAVLLALVLAGFGIDGLSPAVAQSYPARPVTLLVPFAPGGPTDTIGRIMAERMRAPLGQPVVIENVTGAGGSVGVGRVVRAAPDGYGERRQFSCTCSTARSTRCSTICSTTSSRSRCCPASRC
jgi:tripartite-type tricarboxylate transporter receptor subunit TctC